MDVPSITREALKEKIERREAFVLVETLSPASFAKGHLPGAVKPAARPHRGTGAARAAGQGRRHRRVLLVADVKRLGGGRP